MRLLFILCAGFGIGALACALQVILIRRGRLRRNRFIGITTSVTRRSEDVWTRAHDAAARWIGRAGVLAALSAVVAGIGLVVGPGYSVDLFALASGVIGAGAVAAFTFGAEGAAHREVGRRDTRRDED